MAEIIWRAKRIQELLAEGMERFEALATVRQEARSTPWLAIK